MSLVATALGPDGLRAYRVNLTAQPVSYAPVEEEPQSILTPGFVDLQINGGFEIDVESASSQSLEALAHRLRSHGYEAFCPTITSTTAERALKTLENLPESDDILGLHLEGPFISPSRPGAHRTEAIVDPPAGPSAWDAVLDHPRLRIVTLAPERPRALALIDRLVRSGKSVSLGHTEAKFDQLVKGVEAGAIMVTHVFNAMSGLHHRNAGAVGAALMTDALDCGLIYDRHHVSREATAVLLRCKPVGAVFAVSDATRALGMPDGRFNMWGRDCMVRDGVVTLADAQTLAGSAISQLDNFRNLTADFGLEIAIRLCCINPRMAIGETGAPRIYLEFDKSLKLVKRHRVAD